MVKSLSIKQFGKWLAAAAILPVALALGACSADDVELNGKLFDAVGLNNTTKSAEPKMVARAPIIMPPNLERVPEPGKPAEAVASDVTAALNDPDQNEEQAKAELQRKQAEYCKTNYELAKAHGDKDADLATGPLGPCRGSVLTAIEQWNKSEDEAQ